MLSNWYHRLRSTPAEPAPSPTSHGPVHSTSPDFTPLVGQFGASFGRFDDFAPETLPAAFDATESLASDGNGAQSTQSLQQISL